MFVKCKEAWFSRGAEPSGSVWVVLMGVERTTGLWRAGPESLSPLPSPPQPQITWSCPG